MHTQRGNILFLILLAVVLFAALTYAVTKGIQGGGKDASAESDRAGAAAVIGQATAIHNAVMRMTTTGGYRLNQISFGYDVTRYSGAVTLDTYHNNACTTDACRVFKPGGGGVAPVTFEKYATAEPNNWVSTYPKPGFYDIYMGQWPGAKTDANDIIMRIMALKPGICAEIRAQLGLPSAIVQTGPFLAAADPSGWDDTGTTFAPASVAYGRDIGYSTGSNYCNVYAVIGAR